MTIFQYLIRKINYYRPQSSTLLLVQNNIVHELARKDYDLYMQELMLGLKND